MKAAGPDNGKRSEYRAALSNNCIIASRSRSAAAPRTPGRNAWLRHALDNLWPSLVSALSQIAHNSSSAVAFLFLATARAFSRSSCTLVISAAPSIKICPSSTAAIKSCVPVRSSSSARVAINARRIRRNEIESAPPNSLINKRSAVSKLRGCSFNATRARSRNGATAGLPAKA